MRESRRVVVKSIVNLGLASLVDVLLDGNLFGFLSKSFAIEKSDFENEIEYERPYGKTIGYH